MLKPRNQPGQTLPISGWYRRLPRQVLLDGRNDAALVKGPKFLNFFRRALSNVQLVRHNQI
jgi:hypothetical protein